ncbi:MULTISPECIES: quaternary ammonium compound efflux SMR transporter SugE [unclassified Methylophaga]|jgi:quaternary ammonium compound-resistance protein SugE|uniref:quaternary ammonium compound efflux SMR transporter SugE n=1 Tax=unclassified Methylophaga TaxID=2629249 RepID=UPI000C8CBB46|nr:MULTISPECIES: quaternary ammonium compound efflux SMR transporter SugE [unclassified Methylophaga]MAK67816.1 quaternary ammonium compound-resistance protein SugE [Methylophaga sp.]MAY18497.1 quaternary ammonium compound-resistance protein SugE [Methylophaga sp.]MBN45873.1 quaternary ammonium compound-resistance protein SugE [Methylophaga sp.]HAO26247.1 quaternary ammonium compound-resistance protein SugE [Methylophaga sp.]HCD04996.1 quaternary ammonium compound-resistance protein SugE [Meth|tara:strand:- start:27915 stop:28235 length:321 start_codon:yes stop_codon:yes gene_type:complete
MSWLILFLAGLLEVVWAIGLKFTEGFTKPVPSLITLIAMIGSFYLLSFAMRSLPMATAYAIWVGIGIVGASIAGIVIFQESISFLKMVSLLLVVTGIVGLRISSVA